MDRMSKRRSKTTTDQIRDAIDASGVTRYAIAHETGIDESSLAKFYNGKGWLSLESFEALGKFLNLKITLGSKPKQGEK
jgi:transcriptional regulator with XRE-family HTH domain